MKYLKISNKGNLEIDNLVDIASSTKRFKYIIKDTSLFLLLVEKIIDQKTHDKIKEIYLNNVFLTDKEFDNKLNGFLPSDKFEISKKYFRNKNIGKFGTGLKQAYCYFLREDYKFRIFSGLTEFSIYKSKKLSAGVYSDFVTINGKITNLNVAFGIEDYNLGMSISEIWTNAIDEGEYKLEIIDENQIIGETGRTNFFLPYTEEIEEFHSKWNEYFSFEREDRVYIDNEDDERGVEIFSNSDGSLFNELLVYRRGIQVYKYKQPSIFHYRIDDLEITGSRVIRDRWDMDRKILDILANKAPKDIIKNLIKGLNNYNDAYESNLWDSWSFYNLSDSWKEALEGTKIVEKSKTQFYESSIKEAEKETQVLKLPSNLADTIISNNTASHVAGDFSSSKRKGIVLTDDMLNNDEYSSIEEIRELCLKHIPDKIYEGIYFYKSENNKAVVSLNKSIYVDLNNKETIQSLLVKINIENQLIKKYGDNLDSAYQPNVSSELSYLYLNQYNNDFEKIGKKDNLLLQI